MGFERIGVDQVWKGRIADVRVERWRMEDGEEVEREVVGHPGAVGVLAHDGEFIYMVAQPREPVGDPRLLELPAGKLDDDSEDALATAKRELAEEIGKGARTWQHLTTFWSSPGFSDEEIHVYLATDLYDEHAEADENERIEIVKVPISQLDELIRDSRDAKSLAGLLWFKAFGGGAA
jgi:8-oxo-dGTP pyrophosphatase MutT (NUDIX family)